MKKELCFSIIGFITLFTTLNIALFLCFFSFKCNDKAKIKRLEEQIRRLKLIRGKELFEASIQAQEKERIRIGQNLHDDLGTLLASLKLTIGMAVYESLDQAAFDEFKTTCKLYIDKIVGNVRSISHNLFPASLELYGLPAAVEDLAELVNRSENLKVNILNESGEMWNNLPNSTTLSLFRVLEELLTNTLKHAQAQKALISFYSGDQSLIILYQDDGKGMNDSSLSKGMGLFNIKNRLNLINANYAIITSPGEGFRIEIAVQML